MIERYTRDIAAALEVVGPAQRPVRGQAAGRARAGGRRPRSFVIEANPRASRTVPFVSKATGVPLAKVAARVMAGATLADLRGEGLLRPPVTGGHVSVKEAVLPFTRFPDADTLLGPEMRSTGEVMGIDRSFGLAFAKSQAAAGRRAAGRGHGVLLAGRPGQGGRGGRGPAVRPAGLPVGGHLRHGRLLRGRRGAGGHGGGQGRAPMDEAADPPGLPGAGVDAVALIRDGKVDLVVNTPRGRGPRADGAYIRRAANQHRVACLTTRGRGPGRGGRHRRPGRQPAGSPQPAGVSRAGAAAPLMTVARPRRAPAGRSGTARTGAAVDLRTRVGEVTLANPVMTASGTAGHGAELARLPGPGRPRRRGGQVRLRRARGPATRRRACTPSRAGMLNSVGLQNPGVGGLAGRRSSRRWPAAGATVVASIWGFTAERVRTTAAAVGGPSVRRGRPAEAVVAVEANISCPNIEDRSRMFAHSRGGSRARPSARRCGAWAAAVPLWAKLSPNVTDLPALAAAAVEAGAAAVTLINTVMGLALDPATGRPRLGGGGGGLSGPGHPSGRGAGRVRVPGRPAGASRSSGWAGSTGGEAAAELLAAGADAVQVGTATFADPRAPGPGPGANWTAWCAEPRNRDHRRVERTSAMTD